MLGVRNLGRVFLGSFYLFYMVLIELVRLGLGDFFLMWFIFVVGNWVWVVNWEFGCGCGLGFLVFFYKDFFIWGCLGFFIG